ncbi:MAG TPA: site-specific DNA-methyltransferase, partial [Candidatus Thermoplasmatota archaeon]
MTASPAKIVAESLASTDDRRQRLKGLFPEAFQDGTFNPTEIATALGEGVAPSQEKFGLTWVGKRTAIQTLQSPSRATLLPKRTESIDFDETRHVFIEGDNLEVLKLLYKSYFGSVKAIYIDPPYNTGNEFIYPDDFGEGLDSYMKYSGQKDAYGNVLTSNPETSGRYHSKWLSMMYPRLSLAKQLLREDGVIFVSIDDHEIHNLRVLMNEVFGEENFTGVIVWQTATDNNATQIATEHEYIVAYCKSLASQPDWEKPSEKAGAILAKYKELKSQFKNDISRIETELTQWVRVQKKSADVDLSGVEHYCYV